jgi:hypothetical protein
MRASAAVLPMVLLAVALLAGCATPPPSAPSDAPVDFSSLSLSPTATTGIIRGVVVDSAIRPLGNASIALTPGNHTVRSTAAGAFGFDDLAAGTYFLHVHKTGFADTQASTDVVAGVAEPPIVKVQLSIVPGSAPYVEASTHDVFMTCGMAVVASSVGCDTSTADQFGDTVYFLVTFTQLPKWTQGELVWQQTQPAGGEFIWQIAVPGTNNYYSAGETTTSPALAFIDNATLEKNADAIVKDGAEYRVFGGPHPTCTTPPPVPNNYGCGLTLNQRATAYLHSFYNFLPPEGWRFTVDGDPVIPQ